MGSKGSQTSTTTSSLPPQVLQNYQDVVGQAKQVSATPYQQYTGQLVAPENSTEQAATTAATNAQGAYQPYFNQAQGMISNGTQPITPSSVNSSAINNYMSPYTQNVINSTMAQAHQNDAIQQSTLAGNAAAQGAWGGDRSAVAQSLLAGQQDLANNQTVAGLENQNYSQALSEANTQQQVGMTAQQATAANQLQGSGLTGALGNYAQNNQLSGASALMAAGQIGQQTQQNQNTAGYQQFEQQLAYPFQNTQYLANIVEGLGNQGGTSSTTQPSQQANGVLGFLGLKKGGAVNGYDAGGGIPDFESSYVPNVQGGIGSAASSIPNAPSAINNPKQPQANLNQLMNTGESLYKGYQAAKGAYGAAQAGNAADAAFSSFLGGTGTAAAADTAAMTADAAAASSPAWLTSLMAFLHTGGAVKGYAKGGIIPQGYDPGGAVPPPLNIQDTGMGGGYGVQGYNNSQPFFSTIDQMMGPQSLASSPQNFTPAPIDFSKGYVPTSQGSGTMSQPSSIPTAPTIASTAQSQPIEKPQSLDDLQSQLSKTAPVLDKDTAIWQGVAGAMAGKNRGILQNVGEGLERGLDVYSDQKAAVADYALKEAAAQKAAAQMAIEADRYNKQLQIEQENADTNKDYKDAIKDKSTYGTPVPGKGQDSNGNSVDGVYMPNKRTGEMEFKPGIQLTAKPTATSAATDIGDKTLIGGKLNGQEYLDSAKMDPSAAQIVKMIANGEISPGAAGSTRNQYAALMPAVKQYDPSFTGDRFAFRQAFDKPGPNSGSGQLTAINQASAHLGQLLDASQALKNGDVQAVNSFVNNVKNATGDPSVVDFNTAKTAVASELTRVYRGAGGTGEEVTQAEKNLSANSSPAQIRSAVNSSLNLMNGRIQAIDSNYRRVMGKNADTSGFYDDETVRRMKDAGIKIGGEGKSVQSSTAAPSSSAPPGGKLIGHSGGKAVYAMPDGSHVMEQ